MGIRDAAGRDAMLWHSWIGALVRSTKEVMILEVLNDGCASTHRFTA
jgi:hypothetical protein